MTLQEPLIAKMSVHLKLWVAAEDNLWSLLRLVEEGRVGHRHPRHLVVLPVDPAGLGPVGHPHLLGKRLDVRHRCAVDLKLLKMTCVKWIGSTRPCLGSKVRSKVDLWCRLRLAIINQSNNFVIVNADFKSGGWYPICWPFKKPDCLSLRLILVSRCECFRSQVCMLVSFVSMRQPS